MASTVESTAASLADRRRQEGIGLCVTMILQLLAYDSWITVEETLSYLTWIGPEGSTSRVMQMFGGGAVFRRTLSRMDIIRGAKIQGRLQELPITAGPFDGTIPEIEENIQLWAPRVTDGGPPFRFPPPAGNMPWEPLHRYPYEGTYSDDFWEEQETESEGSQVDPMMIWDTDDEDAGEPRVARPEAST